MKDHIRSITSFVWRQLEKWQREKYFFEDFTGRKNWEGARKDGWKLYYRDFTNPLENNQVLPLSNKLETI